MEILVPLSNLEYVKSYLIAGADEFYMGFHDEMWENLFGKYADINRMSGFGIRANPYSFNEILEVIKVVKDTGKKVFITLNANGYSKDQILYMEQHYFPVFCKLDIDGIILSDINVISSVVKHGIKPVASTMCAIYNCNIAKIYYNFGVRRMILPRDLSLKEIADICERMPDVQFEAFFMRNGCIFSDCYCLGMHRPECGATCTYTRYGIHSYCHNYSSFEDYHAVDVNDYLYRTSFHIDACAMCALYKLNEIGISSLKIVGRADDFESVCKDIALTKQNLKVMAQSKTERDYLNNMKFPSNFPQKCRIGNSCYYPEVRFHES